MWATVHVGYSGCSVEAGSVPHSKLGDCEVRVRDLKE